MQQTQHFGKVSHSGVQLMPRCPPGDHNTPGPLGSCFSASKEVPFHEVSRSGWPVEGVAGWQIVFLSRVRLLTGSRSLG